MKRIKIIKERNRKKKKNVIKKSSHIRMMVMKYKDIHCKNIKNKYQKIKSIQSYKINKKLFIKSDKKKPKVCSSSKRRQQH